MKRARIVVVILVGLVVPGLYPSGASTQDSPRAAGGQATDDDDVPPVPPLPAPEEEFQKVLAEPPRAPAPQRGFAPEMVPPVLPVTGGAWVAQGPGAIQNGQVEGITNRPVIGAVQAIVAHPTNADIAWLGAANGGIWKTTNATSGSPTWTPLTDTSVSLSIGALMLDPTDGTNNTLVAGVGRFSSFSSVGGPRSGILRTTNRGTNWTELSGGGMLSGKNISGVAPRGASIVVSVNLADSFTCSNIGIFRSTDTGGSFTKISSGTSMGASGLPGGRAFDLATDPMNNAVLYTAIRDASGCTTLPSAGVNGLYKSADTGATWTRVSSAAMDTLLADGGINNTRIAVGASGQVFVGIIKNGQLAGLFRSPVNPNAATWTELDKPATNEGGTVYGIQPREKPDPPGDLIPGGQGSIHFSIVADPTNPNIVYVGGDRQPGFGDTGATFPNSIGAGDFSGRLFRVDASLAMGSQATPLTHCDAPTPPAACNGITSTNNNSAPHADSRRMVFDFNGNILEGDDGGIYRRTSPQATGDWFSINGNARVTEMHDVAYDTVSNMILSGNQDTGTSEQTTVDGPTWTDVHTGDGGDVAIDDISSGTQSTRYTSFQNLGNFRRRLVNSAGVTTLQEFPPHTVTGGAAFSAQFVTPVEVNKVDATRLLIAGSNDLYESVDRGDTMAGLLINVDVDAMVYGGVSGGVNNAALIYAVSGTNVYVRTAGTGAPVLATPPGGTLRDIAVDSADWQKAYVINSAGQVFSTTNTGATWTSVTGDLGSGATDLRSIAFVPGTPSAVVVGGGNGVFRMATDNVGVWNQFGSGLSNAPVWDMDYDAADDVLVAGTMGRGAWKLTPVANLGPVPEISINDLSVAEGNAGTTTASFNVTLSAPSASTVTVKFATADGTAGAGSVTRSNVGAIAINDNTAGSPYPSTITVPTTLGTITKVTATLTSFSHTFPADVDVLLVGPGGQKIVLMSDAGGSTDATSANLTFDDGGPALTTGPIVTGTYHPTNLEDDAPTGDTFPAPAPVGPYGTALSDFNGTNPAGTWSLYVVDDSEIDSGSIAGGWTLHIETNHPADYVEASNTVTFTPGMTTQPVNITVNGDATFEPNETFFVNLSGATNATVADGQGQGTINNDDAQPTISINDVTVSEGNAGTTNANFTVSLSSASHQTITVTYATADGTATTADGDYAAVAGTVVTFNPGETAKTATVTVNGETKFEPNETFLVNLTAPTNATIADNQGVGTITNDDTQPTISINDVTVTEGNAGTVNANFTVSLSNASSQTITVNYATADNTATAPSDYVAIASTMLAFNAGETSKVVMVVVDGDGTVEPSETFFVNLSGATNATIADNQGVGTITNDDTPPSTFLLLGQRTSPSLGAGVESRFAVALTSGRSYIAFCWQPQVQGGGNCTVDVLNGAGGVDSVAANGEPSMIAGSHTGDSKAIVPGSTGSYFLRLKNNLGSTAETHAAMVETTLFSPWYFVSSGAGYDGFIEIRNSTSHTATGVVVTVFRDDGAVAGSTTLTIPANGTALVPASSLNPNGFGSVQIAHREMPGSLTGNVTTLSSTTGLSFDSPFTSRMEWIVRP